MIQNEKNLGENFKKKFRRELQHKDVAAGIEPATYASMRPVPLGCCSSTDVNLFIHRVMFYAILNEPTSNG